MESQQPVAQHEEAPTIHVGHERSDRLRALHCRVIERDRTDLGARVGIRGKEYPATAWQKCRRAVQLIPGPQIRQRRGRSAIDRDAHQSTWKRGEDDSVARPRRADELPAEASDDPGRTALNGLSMNLMIRREADRLTVRRPEDPARALRAR
jgi:hypothetical protein